MSRTVRNYNFNKGLITEISPLSYPENSCISLVNYVLFRTGLIARRLGIDAETNYTLQPQSPIPYNDFPNAAISANVWLNVAQQGGTNFLVVQVANTLYFHNMNEQGAISTNILPFTVNLQDFAINDQVNAGNFQVTAVSASGYLFVGNDVINPFYITYTPDPEGIATTQMSLQIRDLDGLPDGLGPDDNPTTLSAQHQYNLLNQSWSNDQINTYYNSAYANHTYPSNAQVPYEAKDTNGAFDPAQFANITTGTSQVARGKFLVNPFDIDYSTVSGVPGLTPLVTNNRPTGIATFAGRIWMAVNNKVYFSQVMINDVTKSQNFYQNQDPSAEIYNQLLASDGGVITIQGAANITALLGTENGIIVAATNGIWVIAAPSGYDFSAVSFRTSFVTNNGVWSNNNLVQVEETIFVVSDGGIYVLYTSDRGNIDFKNITQNTIQTFYLSITPIARKQSTITYDSAAKKVYLFYDPNASGTGNKYQYTNVLVFDLSIAEKNKSDLQTGLELGWYTYELSAPQDALAFISDSFLLNTPIVIGNEIDITVNGDTVVVGDNTVVVTDPVPLPQEIGIGYVLLTGNPTNGFNYTIGQLNNDNFFDFQYYDGVGGDYQSTLITGWMDDTLRNKDVPYSQRYQVDTFRRKTAPYIWVFSQRTEENVIDNGSGQATVDFQSSTYMQAIWDWTNQYAPFNRSTPQQVYRLPYFVPLTIGQPFEYPYDVIQTKNIIRGHGKCMSLKLYSETGKDSRIWGWGIEWNVADHLS